MNERRQDDALHAEALALLEAFRAEEEIPAAVHERVWAEVQQRVEADEHGDTRRILTWGAVGLGLAAALVLVVSGTWERATSRRSDRARGSDQAIHGLERNVDLDATRSRPLTPAHADTTPSERPLQAEPLPDATPDPALAPPIEGERGTRTREAGKLDRASAPRHVESSAPAGEDPLAEETRRMREVATALKKKEAARALQLLDAWATDFPDGVLVQERQALRAISLCEAGNDSEGRAASAAFLRSYPSAALADRVRDACAR